MSKIEVDTIAPQSGTNINLGESGDTVTVPTGVTFDASNATTTLPSTVVTTTGTQTLTNKTIDSDNNTITNIANAGIKAGAAIDYSKLNLTGNIALADLSATGTKDSTTFLRGDNTFAEAGGGSLVYLASASGTNVSSLSFDGYFTSAYTHYKFIYSVYGATSNTDTWVRYRKSNADVTSSYYNYAGDATYVASGTVTGNTQGAWGYSAFHISSTDNTADSKSPTTGELILFNALSTTQYKTFISSNLGYNSGDPPTAIRNWNYAGIHTENTNALSGLSFLYDGGNISGQVQLYGIKNS